MSKAIPDNRVQLETRKFFLINTSDFTVEDFIFFSISCHFKTFIFKLLNASTHPSIYPRKRFT